MSAGLTKDRVTGEVRKRLSDERAASWKYLLPAETSARSLVLSPSIGCVPFALARTFDSVTVAGPSTGSDSAFAAWAAETGLDNIKTESISRAATGRYDVIVIEAGFEEEAAARICGDALEPGGAVLRLGRSGRKGPSARSCARLWGSLGWDVESVFSFLPSLDGYKLVVPLRPRAVFASGLRMHNTLTLRSSLKKTAVGLLGRLGLLDRLMPGYALIMSRGGLKGRGWLHGHLTEKAGLRDFHIIVHNASPGEGAKAILKVVDGGGRALTYAKVADNRARGEFIENEYRALSDISAMSFDTADIPRPMGYDVAGSHHIMLMAPGSERFGRNIRHMDEAVLAFLIELFEKTSTVVKLEDSPFWRETAPVLEDFKAGPYGAEFGWLSEMGMELFEELRSTRLPFGVVHRDFVGWNVKRGHDGRLLVMDWEWSRPGHLPLQDFFHFILLTEWANSGRSVEDVLKDAFFSGETKYAGFLRRYAAALDIPVEKSYYLLLLYLVEWTVFHIKQITEARQWASETLELLAKARKKERFNPENWLKG